MTVVPPAAFLAVSYATQINKYTIHTHRSYFGVLKVQEYHDGEHRLIHGTTLHGIQNLDPMPYERKYKEWHLTATAHPLLSWALKDEEIVRNRLEILPPAQAVLFSGPNTGGKTVFLKALGVGAACARTGFFFPGPDHYETTVNTPLQLRSGAAMGQLLGYPLENDLNANGATGAIGFFGSSGTTITAVSVPAINATQVSAVLGVSGTIDITPASGFRGLTYVDYTVRFGGGEIQTGRMYVRVR